MRRTLEFSKYHGCGNDFIIVDETSKTSSDEARSDLAKILCDRYFQIGADGVIFLEKAGNADVSMRLFEPAGNEADMCGNGIRCVAAFVGNRNRKSAVDVLTKDGIKRIVREGDRYSVDMGPVRTLRKHMSEYIKDRGDSEDPMLAIKIQAGRRQFKGAIVNTGEPHIVIRVSDIDKLDLSQIGEAVNQDKRRFPRGVNLNFVKVLGSHAIRIRTYERGVYDETMACGTGATASAAVALMLKWVKPGRVKVRTEGGELLIDIAPDGKAFMTGPAVHVFDGRIVTDV